MKSSIKIIIIVVMLFLKSFATYAQTDHWSGEWNTTFGKLVITKNGAQYTGTFPKGRLTEGKEQNGMLIGKYTRATSPSVTNSLGKKGEYKFILSEDKSKFEGYHKSESDRKWGIADWSGEKIWGHTIPVIVSSDIPHVVTPSWTGTWESTTGHIFKILDTGNIRTSITDVFAKISVQVAGTTKNYDVKGYFAHDKPEVFQGTLYQANGWDAGLIVIAYGMPKIDDFTGFIWFGSDSPKMDISAHRTSSAKPTVKIF